MQIGYTKSGVLWFQYHYPEGLNCLINIQHLLNASSLSPSESSTAPLHGAAGAPGAGRRGRGHLLLDASRSCKLYEILCRAGRRNDTSVARHIGRFNNDAAVGILTLGKRKVGERRVQDRLQQLLHGSRNQAAGILTMGKRLDDGAQLPLQYLMPRAPEDLDAYEKRWHLSLFKTRQGCSLVTLTCRPTHKANNGVWK